MHQRPAAHEAEGRRGAGGGGAGRVGPPTGGGGSEGAGQRQGRPLFGGASIVACGQGPLRW